jgi:hypothetical protein
VSHLYGDVNLFVVYLQTAYFSRTGGRPLITHPLTARPSLSVTSVKKDSAWSLAPA